MPVALVAFLLLSPVAGCGAKPPAADAPSDAPAAAEPPVQPATIEQLHELVRAPGARVVLVNVWATWCIPCREEFPDLLRVHREYRDRGLRLLLVSADFDDQRSEMLRFLGANGVDFLTYLQQGDDMAFIESLDAGWSGALPATALYDASGRKLWFREGKTTYEMLSTRIEEALAASSRPTP